MPVGAFPHGQTIVLHRRVVKKVAGQRVYDAYGNLIYVDSDITVPGCAVWPESATEVLQGVDRTNVIYLCALPSSIFVDADDHVTWEGRDYEVQGEPQRYHAPATGTELQTIRLNRVEG